MARARASRLPAGITHHKGRYRVRLYAGNRQHNLGVYDTLKVARAVLDTARSQKAMGPFVPPDELRARAKPGSTDESGVVSAS